MIDQGGKSDADLIARTLNGDLGAFDTLVLRYERAVYNVAFRVLLSRDDAEDAAVEAFVKIHAGLGSYRPDMAFRPWALRIATNTALNTLRARRPAPLRLDQPADEDGYGLDVADPGPGPEDQTMDRVGLAQLEREVENLPEIYRIPFVLMYMEGLDCREIAEALDLTVGAVKTRLSRAREMLRARLAQVEALKNGL